MSAAPYNIPETESPRYNLRMTTFGTPSDRIALQTKCLFDGSWITFDCAYSIEDATAALEQLKAANKQLRESP